MWFNPETGSYDEEAIDIAPEFIRFLCNKYWNILKKPIDQQTKQVVTS
jgi:hypothetical protein